MKYFKNIYTLPILWHYLVTKEKDLKYLLLPDYQDEEISEELYKELAETWEKINYQAEKGSYDTILAELRERAWEWFYLYKTKEQEQKYNNAFAKYKQELGESFKDFQISDSTLFEIKDALSEDNLLKIYELHNKKFAKVKDIYEALKELFEYSDLLNVRLLVFEYLEYENKIEYNLSDEITTLETILKITINDTTCSVSKFHAYRRRAKEINKNVKKDKR